MATFEVSATDAAHLVDQQLDVVGTMRIQQLKCHANAGKRSRQLLRTMVVLCSVAASFGSSSFVLFLSPSPAAPAATKTATTQGTRRLLLASSLGTWLLGAEADRSRAEVRLEDALPALPKDYRDAALAFASGTKQALLTAVKANREGFSKETKARLEQDEAVVARLLRDYEEKYLSPGAILQLTPVVREHPVYFALKGAIARLSAVKSGQGVDDPMRFRLDLLRELNTVLTLIDRAGVAA